MEILLSGNQRLWSRTTALLREAVATVLKFFRVGAVPAGVTAPRSSCSVSSMLRTIAQRQP